jgi:hypothetical protein
MPRQAELPDEEDVQRRVKRLSHFKRDRDAAARQRQYDNIRPAGILPKFRGQLRSSFTSIRERSIR